MVLNAYGFGLSKTTIVDSYLFYGDNFVTSFCGSPYSSSGAGIYAPGLCATANRFLIQNGSSLRATDVSGSSASTLCAYVSQGTPVMVWNTDGYGYPRDMGYGDWYNGTYYPWFQNEHCVVLAGCSADSVLLYDSINGVIWVDASTFWGNYEAMGRMAVVIG